MTVRAGLIAAGLLIGACSSGRPVGSPSTTESSTTESTTTPTVAPIDWGRRPTNIVMRVDEPDVNAMRTDPPGPWFTLYGDGTTIFRDAGHRWLRGTMTPEEIAALLSEADRLGLLDRMVTVDGPLAEDELPTYISVHTSRGEVTHELHGRDPMPGFGPLVVLVSAIRHATSVVRAEVWTSDRWLQLTPAWCVAFVGVPSDPAAGGFRPVMPDEVDRTLEEIAGRAACAA